MEFRWLLAEASPEGSPVPATAGTPLRTRLLAFDAQGHPARISEHSGLRVDVRLSGHAQLTRGAPLPSWAHGELRLDIENEAAELVDAELQVRGAGPAGNVTLVSRIQFAAAEASDFELVVRPSTLGSAQATRPLAGASRTTWPTQVVLEVALSGRDRFGNQVPGSSILGAADFVLRGTQPLAILGSGHLQLDEAGNARALARGVQPGVAELWLEQSSDGFASRKLLESVSLRLEFAAAVGAASGRPSEGGNRTLSPHDAEWQPLATEVRDAFLHAWRGYRRYAWGADELQPLSKKGRDSFGNIGMTILDSLTTLHLMGLHKEFEQGADFVKKDLDFDHADREVSVFELNIRALGGLLGAHSLTERPVFLERAVELAERLLPALNSSSGLPMPRWNIARQGGTLTGEPTVLAEAGSLQLEFRHLSAVTGDPRYGRAADACFDAIQAVGFSGLMPVQLTPPNHSPPQAVLAKYAVGALADSYYEYLLKQWLQSPSEERFKAIWLRVMAELPALVRPPPGPEAGAKAEAHHKFKLLELAPNGAPILKMDHLSCFAPGMIALGLLSLPASDLPPGRNASWLQLAEGLTASCADLWMNTKSGLAPEYAPLNAKDSFGFLEAPQGGRHSFLRPETAESLFYLYRLTGKKKYRRWGARLFRAILAHAKVDAGFASVANVNQVPTEKMDDMQSFVMAETFKYLYLLFSPKEALDLDSFVLNTEAHPLRKPGPRSL